MLEESPHLACWGMQLASILASLGLHTRMCMRVCGDGGVWVQYEAMAMVGYRDEKETFLVDFEQKRWQHDAEQGARDGREPGAVAGRPAAADQDCPEAVVRRHLGLVRCALVRCPLCLNSQLISWRWAGDGRGAGAVLLQLGDEVSFELLMCAMHDVVPIPLTVWALKRRADADRGPTSATAERAADRCS